MKDMIELTSKQRQYERIMFKWGESLVLEVKFRLWILFGVYIVASEFIPDGWSVAASVLFLIVWWFWIERPEGAMIRKALHLTPLPKKEKKNVDAD